ncbi:MAG: DNA polymerase III subunit alpha, partial [Oligoflexales bacterium]|nr:DNA polymerase III subunit alpha [Oligoflexales bacterium]
NDIPVGPGRGSGAGSLVAYALKITDLDPIPLNLIFERFLNPERVSMPDFDVDFCQNRRDEVIKYVTQKYGRENVGQITTFGKMKAKAAIRDVGRVLEIGYSRVDRIAKLIPNDLDITLDKALEQEPRILEEAEKDGTIDDMIRLARKIEGLNRHTSVHAAGVVISNGGMENFIPVYRSDENFLITQYEMKNVEKIGLVKFDFLGLKTLTVVKKTVDLIKSNLNPDFRIELIDIQDKSVYENISTGNTIGIFQLESSGMQTLVSKLKPSCFEDLIAVVALFRPGPLGSGMVDDFIDRKHGKQEIRYLLPQLEPILKETYGIILYQEQVQKIAATLANYSLGEADLLRRAMGKKKPEEMAKQKQRFLSGAKSNGINEEIADEIFELMAKFADYGFNKSHSAAYGLVSYQTAFLKTHHTEFFMAAIMTCDLDNTDKITRYIHECRRLNFKILPPNINRSKIHFDVPAKATIGFALAAIKGLGEGPLMPILSERESGGPFKSLTDLARRLNLQKIGKKTLELLVEAGALDDFNPHREALFNIIPDLVKISENYFNAKSTGQKLLFEMDPSQSDEIDEIDLSKWSPELLERKNRLTKLEWLLKEQKLLGVFLSRHPIELYKDDVKKFGKLTIGGFAHNVGCKNMPVVGYLSEVSEAKSKSGDKMYYITLEDMTGCHRGIMFDRENEKELPEQDQVVIAYVSVAKRFEDSRISLAYEDIFPIEKARKTLIKKAFIDFHIDSSSFPVSAKSRKKLFENLRCIIEENPGETELAFRLNYSKGTVIIDSKIYKVDLNDTFFQNILMFSECNTNLNY